MDEPLQKTVVMVDVAGFGVGSNPHQLVVREWLFTALEEILEAAGRSLPGFSLDERGDGALIIIPPAVSVVKVVRIFTVDLARRLRVRNEVHPAAERIALRVAVHVGLVHSDPWGSVGSDVNLVARLEGCRTFRRMMLSLDAEFGVIVSGRVFEQVICNRYDDIDPAAFRRISVFNKETRTRAWVGFAGIASSNWRKVLNKRRNRALFSVFALFVVAVILSAVLAVVSSNTEESPAYQVPFTAQAAYLLEDKPIAVHSNLYTPDDIPGSRYCRDLESEVVRRGGFFASGTPVRITLIGLAKRTVVIGGIRAQVMERSKPATGTAFACVNWIDARASIPLTVDLDSSDPRVSKSVNGSSSYFADSVVELAPTESVTFDIRPVTEDCACGWTIRLFYADEGQDREMVIMGEGGGLFRTSSVQAAGQSYVETGGVWRRR
ncbi:hypothetical protein ACFQ05_36335 [Amycolatopsis umgeniensis]|uniref:Class 3 adenylate cyclase n=1 Tax=Amycolatopsis umgeniensis TaxID=336628 RepID=A0A841BAB4_9PSEU|nr:hypothetical protein [Amycolatopsis umgeniensis]MBB5855568.1 class 3 adenylate cyclase [Amycolatopsis umgeniensis]